MEYVLGIDIGTGSVKAIAVDLQGRSFEVSQQHYGFKSSQPGFHEQDPAQIWKAFSEVLKEIIVKTNAQPLGIGLSSAMHSLIAVDRAGNELAPMMTWADNRSADIAGRLRDSAEGMAIYRATGTPVHAMSPLCKLIWIRESDPKLFDDAYKFISIKEYIWYRIFGEFKVDQSIASCTGLFDIHTFTWHEDALRLAGITNQLLSEPVPTDYVQHYKGNAVDSLLTGVPVTIGASDGCLANLGSMAHRPGTAVMTIGTSGAVRVASSKPLMDEKSMTFSYVLDKDTYICGGPINNGGIALEWWLKNNSSSELADEEYDYLIDQTAQIPAGSDGLIFLPYLTGERAPVWDSQSCGVFFGIRLSHKKAHFTKAVLEGICYAMNTVLTSLSLHNVSIEQINVSGGFINSMPWLQILADVTGKELVIIQSEDASAIGAAFMAMKNTGLIKDYPSSGSSGEQVIKPNELTSVHYSKDFIIFQKLYLDLKKTMHEFYHLHNSASPKQEY